MDSKNLIQMIAFEVELLKEKINKAEFQSQASASRIDCIKIRKDLLNLYNSLGRFKNYE